MSNVVFSLNNLFSSLFCIVSKIVFSLFFSSISSEKSSSFFSIISAKKSLFFSSILPKIKSSVIFSFFSNNISFFSSLLKSNSLFSSNNSSEIPSVEVSLKKLSSISSFISSILLSKLSLFSSKNISLSSFSALFCSASYFKNSVINSGSSTSPIIDNGC